MSLKDFSGRLKWLMELEGISRRALAVKANVQRRSLLNYLNAKNYPRYDALIRLSDFFEVKTDYLLALENCSDKTKSRIQTNGKGKSIEEVIIEKRENRSFNA